MCPPVKCVYKKKVFDILERLLLSSGCKCSLCKKEILNKTFNQLYEIHQKKSKVVVTSPETIPDRRKNSFDRRKAGK